MDFPKASLGFQSDEATYYTLGQSLAHDGDFAFDRNDLARVWREFPSGPEGIFLKKGQARWLERTPGFPWIHLASGADPRADRLYFGKSFAYPLAAAPFVWLFGTGGFLLLHGLLLGLDLLAAYWFLRARSEPTAALAYAAVFFLASAAPVYFVWITPEIFNLSMGVLGLFCGTYRMVSPAVPAEGGWWSRFLRGAGGPLLGAAIIGVAAFSKPTNAALAVPIVAAALLHADWRRGWRIAAGAALTFLLSCGALWGLNLATSGEVNYQGGSDRATYYLAKGFPFMTSAPPATSPLVETRPEGGGGAVGLARGRNDLLREIILSRNSLVEVFPKNLVYFMVGRHSGLVPYFFPGVLSVLLFLFWRGGRSWFQWIALGTSVFANVVLLLWVPYTYSGGGGPIGNRYFMGLYPLLLFVTPPLRSALPAIVGLGIGGLFTAALVLNPFYTSAHPAEHAKHGPLRWLPIEKSLLNDLPVNVTPERARIQLAGTPRITAYFLDENAYPPEGEWFWVKGASRTDVLLRAPAQAMPGTPLAEWPSYRLKALRVEIRTGDVPNTVTIATGADRQTLRLDAHRESVTTVRAEQGLPYRAHLDQPTSYVYTVSITSETGFTPIFSQGGGVTDQRYLGVLVRLVPMYQTDTGPPVLRLPAVRVGVQLQGRVPDAEALGQAGLGSVQRIGASGEVVDDQVRRQGDEPAGDAPDVQIVDIPHAGQSGQRETDLVEIDVGRDALHQHADRFAEQLPGRVDHQQRDEDRRHRIDPGPAERRDGEGGDDRLDAAERVGEDVEPGAAQVQVAAPAAAQDEQADHVHGQAGDRHDQHQAAFDDDRRPQPADRLDDDQERDADEGRAVGQRGQDLGALIAVGPRRRRRAAAKSHREQGQRDGCRVAGHVAGVGQQGQRAGDEAAGDFGEGKAGHERQRPGQPPRPGIRRRVDMPVVGRHRGPGLRHARSA